MGIWATARRSTIRMIKDTSAAISSEIGFVDFDDHVDLTDLPKKDLIGLVGFSCTEVGKFHDLVFGVAVMMHQDVGLSRMTNYIDVFFDRLAAEQRFHLYNDQGQETSQVVVLFDGTSVTPMARADFRSVQTIECSARVVPIGQSS